MENWGQGKTDLGLRIGRGHSQGILEPEEPINSLRGVECTDNEKESLGSWETQAIGTAAQTLAWRAAGRATARPLWLCPASLHHPSLEKAGSQRRLCPSFGFQGCRQPLRDCQ